MIFNPVLYIINFTFITHPAICEWCFVYITAISAHSFVFLEFLRCDHDGTFSNSFNLPFVIILISSILLACFGSYHPPEIPT